MSSALEFNFKGKVKETIKASLVMLIAIAETIFFPGRRVTEDPHGGGICKSNVKFKTDSYFTFHIVEVVCNVSLIGHFIREIILLEEHFKPL